MRTYVLSDGLILETSDWAEARAARERGEVIWVDLDAEPTEAANQFLTWLGIHDLTMEDIWHERLFPKLEDFDGYLVVLVHGVHREQGRDGELAVVEIEIILGQGFVVTHAHGESRSIAAVRDEVLRTGRCLKKGPAWVLHGVLDHAVDRYLPVIDQLDERDRPARERRHRQGRHAEGPGLLTRILAFKRALQQLRRMGIHQREILLRLARGEFEEIPRETMPFFRDVYDHFLRDQRTWPRATATRDERARGLPQRAVEPHERGDEDADPDLDGHAAADVHRRRLRHELRVHAGAGVVVRLPVRARADGAGDRGHPRVLPQAAVAVAPRIAVVGHVEHVTLGRVESVPHAGDIAHLVGAARAAGRWTAGSPSRSSCGATRRCTSSPPSATTTGTPRARAARGAPGVYVHAATRRGRILASW